MANPFKSIEREIKKGINRLGDQVKSGINKLGNEVESGVKKVGHEVESGVKTAGNTVKHEVESVGKNAVHEVEALGKKSINELESEFKKATHKIEDVAEKAIDELEAEAKAVLNAIFAELTSQGFQKALKVLEKVERIGETALKDASFSVDISAIGFSWGNLGGRVGEIRGKIEELAKKTPKLSRAYIIECVDALAPDTISLSLDVKLAALIVTSDDVGVGFGFSISTPAFLEASDELLDAMGL